MKPSANPRATAAQLLGELVAGKGSLAGLFDDLADDSNAGLIRELCYGCCRHYQALGYLLHCLLERPLRRKDLDVDCLLRIGLYQLRHLRVPDHAAVNETVAATRVLGKTWAGGLVNAVMRNYIKNKAGLEERLAQAEISIRCSHPGWLLQLLQQDWPDHWPEILAANNQRPPMTLRVNLRLGSREDYLAALAAAGISARPGLLSQAAVYLEAPRPVDELPGFDLGRVSVQDEASQLVAGLLDLGPGQRVLDACAAPGGKTAHILESEQLLTEVIALDASESRLSVIKQNLQRLGLAATVVCGDGGAPETWWDGRPFDRILLDAPCSATGVIRRHPDIKLLRRPEDIPALARRQSRLLAALWQCLRPGGLLLYTTCSLLREENEQVINGFLQQAPDAKYAPIAADWGVKCGHGRQLLPSREGSDGFYYCRLQKAGPEPAAP